MAAGEIRSVEGVGLAELGPIEAVESTKAKQTIGTIKPCDMFDWSAM